MAIPIINKGGSGIAEVDDVGLCPDVRIAAIACGNFEGAKYKEIKDDFCLITLRYNFEILLKGGRLRPFSTTGTTPQRSRPSSVSVPVLSKQMTLRDPASSPIIGLV